MTRKHGRIARPDAGTGGRRPEAGAVKGSVVGDLDVAGMLPAGLAHLPQERRPGEPEHVAPAQGTGRQARATRVAPPPG
ncbi:hypothetical protein GCM10009827_034670 [Dactylosporangium maewongense]|uniref:Uncharacterized protein n=1 Tax=Dactylosporangium maewongense TaxID=634393 RepID=A0ABN2AED6_9ACTN